MSGFVGGWWCPVGMPRKRLPGSPVVVYRTARCGLRVTGGQRRRLFGLLRSAGDVWCCVLELNAWRRRRVDAPLAGYRELCMTVDLPVQGRRERDIRNAFTMPLRPRLATAWDLLLRPKWLLGVLRAPPRFGNFQAAGSSSFTSVAEHVGSLFDPTANWADIARLRERWRGPVVIKGVLHPDDARRAVEIGADAVMVSNHGGRQLDRVPAAITALPDIVAAVNGRAQVILDGGVRRGTDIVVAQALGAAACSIGRAFVWGLATAGQHGVERAIRILHDELDNTLTLMGAAPQDLNGAYIRRRNFDPPPTRPPS